MQQNIRMGHVYMMHVLTTSKSVFVMSTFKFLLISLPLSQKHSVIKLNKTILCSWKRVLNIFHFSFQIHSVLCSVPRGCSLWTTLGWFPLPPDLELTLAVQKPWRKVGVGDNGQSGNVFPCPPCRTVAWRNPFRKKAEAPVRRKAAFSYSYNSLQVP